MTHEERVEQIVREHPSNTDARLGSFLAYADELHAALEAERESWRNTPPHEMVLLCPACGKQHLDIGEFATRVHRKHLCENTTEGPNTGCGHLWVPFPYATKGIDDGASCEECFDADDGGHGEQCPAHCPCSSCENKRLKSALEAERAAHAETDASFIAAEERYRAEVDAHSRTDARREAIEAELEAARKVVEHTRLGMGQFQGATSQLIAEYDATRAPAQEEKTGQADEGAGKCQGRWLSGSGGHIVWSHDCGATPVWEDDDDGERFCDEHLPRVNGEIHPTFSGHIKRIERPRQ